MSEEQAAYVVKPEAPAGLKMLRDEFLPSQYGWLPQPMAKKEVMDTLPKATCKVCGGYHATSKIIHLQFVGHAAVTDRLLDADPNWYWEPLAFTTTGLPAFDEERGLWIKLTICGVTRLGYGSAEKKQHMVPGAYQKEIIGDAIRNAAMRFGVGLALWHKGELHPDKPEDDGDGLTDAEREARDKALTEAKARADAAAKKAMPAYTDLQLTENLPGWRDAMAVGKTTPEKIIAKIETKYTLTQAQKDKIK